MSRGDSKSDVLTPPLRPNPSIAQPVGSLSPTIGQHLQRSSSNHNHSNNQNDIAYHSLPSPSLLNDKDDSSSSSSTSASSSSSSSSKSSNNSGFAILNPGPLDPSHPDYVPPSYPLFVRSDIDAFIALFNNNLATLLVVISLLSGIVGPDIVYGKIMPGVGMSMVYGNVYYVYMARKLSRAEGRIDVCAQPYGINTPGAFAFVFSIVAPVFAGAQGTLQERQELAWKVGVAANFVSGLILIAGGFIGDKIRKWTPTVALMSALAGIGFAFLTLNEFLDLAAQPIISYLPLMIVMTGYFGNVSMGPLPIAVIAMIVGTVLSWIVGVNTKEALIQSGSSVKMYAPVFPIADIFRNLNQIGPYISIVVPVSITVAVGTIQCVESAEIAGDRYNTRESMFADGIGTVIGALFGSILGTTVYIGHPAFKAMGARSGYSLMNAAAFLIICFTGLAAPILAFIAVQSIEPIIIFVGLIICSDTLAITPRRHFPAFLVGLIPLVAQWGDTSITSAVSGAYDAKYGAYLNGSGLAPLNFQTDIAPSIMGIPYNGLRSLGYGGLLESIFLSAIFLFLIDRRFSRAAVWCLLAAFLAIIGLINAEKVGFHAVKGDQGWRFVVAYVSCAVLFGILWEAQKRGWVEKEWSEADDVEVGEVEKQGSRAEGELPAEVKPSASPSAPPASVYQFASPSSPSAVLVVGSAFNNAPASGTGLLEKNGHLRSDDNLEMVGGNDATSRQEESSGGSVVRTTSIRERPSRGAI